MDNLIFIIRTAIGQVLVYLKEFSWPTKYQWSQFFKVLTKKEKYFIFGLFTIFFLSLVFLTGNWYLANTQIAADYGGKYQEGIIGFPRYLNPLLAQISDADRDISTLVFSGLLKYNSNGQLIPDLAEKYSTGQDGTTYDFFLKRNVIWHDGKNLTADDIIFTLSLIQNPDYKSPLRMNFTGVEVEKIDNYALRLKLKNPYAPFLNNLTFGILPKHLWEKIPVASFPLVEYNLKPIGSGPYKFKEIQKDKSGTVKILELEAFSDYYFRKPLIETIIFRFFKDEDSAITAYNNKKINGLSFISASNLSKLKNNFNLNKFVLPRYFAVFFNQTTSKILADKAVRQALAYATDRNEIIKKVLLNYGLPVDSPFPEVIFGLDRQGTTDEQISPSTSSGQGFNLDQAKNILEAAGWSKTDQSAESIRKKVVDNQTLLLEISLLTVNFKELVEVANLLKSNWQSIGVKVNLEIEEVAAIGEEIRNRQYQALLFGQILGLVPDPFAFWHSSQKKEPGLNLALYDNKEADKLLEEARIELNQQIRNQKYNQFQKLVSFDLPAIFLYTPIHLYPTDKKVKGIEIKNIPLPSARFSQIENWYIKTKRVWK